MHQPQNSTRPLRFFLPNDFKISDWEGLAPYLDMLESGDLTTSTNVEQWLRQSGELEAVVNEDLAWRYIRMTRDTTDAGLRNDYEYFIMEILPKWTLRQNELLKKLYHSPGFGGLDPTQYHVFVREVKNRIELFRESNVPLEAEHRKVAREFDEIASGMSVEVGGEHITLQKAAAFLEQKDRHLRQTVWEATVKERLKHKKTLDALMTKLLSIRAKMASNAGFESFADYKFRDMGRFDYGRKDAEAFHEAVERTVTPELVRRCQLRAKKLGLDMLRPWDLNVDEDGQDPLKPFQTPEEMLRIVVSMFERLDQGIASNLRKMDEMGHFDLGSRMGKAPGGYNYGLQETGVPFIFMNAVGTQADLIVMLHEAGHAVHSFATHPIEVAAFKHLPAEIAELASMSMELVMMDFLDEAYSNPLEIVRAKKEQLMRPLLLLPWIATIDCFQFWLHDHPGHSEQERAGAWMGIYHRFHGHHIDWTGYEDALEHLWQKQGHVYEVPFYYIEYGIAQLGALGVWRNYRQNPSKGVQDYLAALALGYSKTIPEVYERAGVKFDFSEQHIREVILFLGQELNGLDS